jgi:hypothetical protein
MNTGQVKPELSERRVSRFVRSVAFLRKSLISRDLSWLLLLILLNGFFFGDALFSDMTFYARDVSTFHYPLKKLVTEAYKNGEWPLWNPFMQMGQPLLANPNSMALYPTQLFFHFLPFEVAFEIHFVLHCMLAGVCSYLLARRLMLTRLSAFLAAGIYNFGGISLSFVNLFNILPVVAFLPLLGLVLDRVVRSQSAVNLALATGSLACFLLLLEPLSSMAIALFLLLLLLFVILPEIPRIRWGKAIAVLLLVMLSGLLLASIQILPTLELIQSSGRNQGLRFEVATFWSLHPVNLLQSVCPSVFGEYFKLQAPVPWATPFFDGREPYLLSCYFGVIPLLLAIWACVLDRGRIAKFLIVSLLISFILSMGKNTPIYGWLYQTAPPFRFGRYPIKFLLVVNLCIALLAGIGLDRLNFANGTKFCHPAATRRLRLFLFLILALLAISAALRFEETWIFLNIGHFESGQLYIGHGDGALKISKSIMEDAFRHIQLQLGAFLAIVSLACWKAIKPRLLGAGVTVFIVFDLFISNSWINPLIHSEFFDPAPAALYLGKKHQEIGPFRIYRFEPPRLSDHPSVLYETDSIVWLSLYRKLTLYPFLAAKDHVEYSVFPSIDKLETSPVQRILQMISDAKTLEQRLSLLAKLNVLYVLAPTEIIHPLLTLEAMFRVNSDQPLRLYRLEGASPRAFLTDSESVALSIPEDVFVDGGASPKTISDGTSDGVRVTRYSFTHVELDAEAKRPCHLVLADSNYAGWRARIDGHPARIESAAEIYRAVKLPAGKHHVTFSYEPKSFQYGLWTTTLTGLALTSAVLYYGLCKLSVEKRSHAAPD